MKQISTPKYKLSKPWLCTWVILFALMLILSIIAPNGNLVTLVKLGGIVLCLFYVAHTFPRDYLLLLAMLSTCLADIVLAANNTASLGIIIFLIAQILHFYRLNAPRLKTLLLAFILCAATFLILDIIFDFIPLLFLASGLYAVMLAANIVACATQHRRNPHNLRIAIALAGFITFACCDFCTGISYLALISAIPHFLYAPANFIVWLFYYPSQVLLSNTGQPRPQQKSRPSLAE